MEQMNSKEYWEKRFNTNWELWQGGEQTAFFANIAVNLLPDWLKNQISCQQLSICDFGCALGQGVDVLHNALQTKVLGVDFAENAILKAKQFFPQYDFIQKDIKTRFDSAFRVDVGYISNVLEHMEDPWSIAENISYNVDKYLIVMIPFRETMFVDEHQNKFDTRNIPLSIGACRLIFANYTDCRKIENTPYADWQILLIYASPKADEENDMLSEVVSVFEYHDLLALNDLKEKYEQKIEEQRKIYEARLLEKENTLLERENRLSQMAGTLSRKENELSGMACKLFESNKRIDKMSEELRIYKDEISEKDILLETNNKQIEYMKNMIYELQIEQQKIYQSTSWKISRPVRWLSKLLKAICSFDLKKVITSFRKTTLYNDYLKKVVPTKWRMKLAKKLYNEVEVLMSVEENEQYGELFNLLFSFEKELKNDDQLLLVFSGVKYIDSEGQRNIRLIHEARQLGKKIVFAYWRWPGDGEIDESEEDIIKIPIDILNNNKVYFFETFFRNISNKCLLVEFPHPSASSIIEIASSFGWKTVYDVIDDWEEFSHCGQADWYNKKVERRIANIVDANIATAKVLKEKIQKEIICDKPYYVISNGVDPNRMKKSEKIPEYNHCKGNLQVGYFGHLTSAWFDWELVNKMAVMHKEWTFHIIGYGAPEELRVPDNVILYGKKAPDELPKYAAYWDVAIIPFINNELTKGVNPIKVFEYLQLGLPVVASYMPEIVDYPYVSVTQNEDEFVQAINKARTIDLDSAIIRQFIEKNTWRNKCIEVLKCIENIPAKC